MTYVHCKIPHTRKPSQGPGWGGPAKGASAHPGEFKNGLGRKVGSRPPAAVAASRLERAERLKATLYELATTAKHPEARISAAEAYLSRVLVLGAPVNKLTQQHVDALNLATWTDAQLEAALAT